MPFGIAAILGGAGILGSVAGAGIGANAAGNAAQLQSRASNRAIDTQQNEFSQILQNLAPFLQGGQGAAALLEALYGVNTAANGFGANFGNVGGSFLQSPTATLGQAPTYNYPSLAPFTQAQFQQSPGYQYELGQQQQAIQNSAAGRTGAISGNTLQALQGNAQGLASQDWWNAYNAYNQMYNTNQQNYANQFNSQNQNYWNQFNAINNQRGQITNALSSLAGQGLGAAGQGAQAGTTAGQGIAQTQLGQGNALAAGQIGVANALAGPQGGINSGLTALLSALSGNSGGAAANSPLAYLFGNGGGGGVGYGGWIPTS